MRRKKRVKTRKLQIKTTVRTPSHPASQAVKKLTHISTPPDFDDAVLDAMDNIIDLVHQSMGERFKTCEEVRPTDFQIEASK